MNTGKALFALVLLAALGAAGYFVYQNYLAPAPQAVEPAIPEPASETAGQITAEGKVIPARQVSLAFAGSGRMTQVLVKEGQMVKAGEILARLDDQSRQVALTQAEAALSTARANLQAARTRLEAARLAARTAEAPALETAWDEETPKEFEQPNWYFEKDLRVVAAQKEVDAARAALDVEESNLQIVLKRASSADLLAVERRMVDAREAFLVAREILDRAKAANDEALRDQAQALFDSAQSELKAAQTAYDQILNTQGAADILEARARLAVAQARYEYAMQRLDDLQTGERSPEVRQAADAVTLAEAAVAEAEAAVQAARVSLEDATLIAPLAGVVVQIDAEVGEMVVPGQQVLLLADLASWMIETTDLSETDVPLLAPGMPADISLDAFPERTFKGRIEKIALVSQDSRGSVTYTVTLSFDPSDAPLRWGMTAFVKIAQPAR